MAAVIKAWVGSLTQTAADATTVKDYVIPVNSFAPLQPPVLKLIGFEWKIDETLVVQWTIPVSQYFSFIMQKIPQTVKSTVFDKTFVLNGVIWAMDTSGVWYPPAQGLPLVYGNEVSVTLKSYGTGVANNVSWRLYYEEIPNPTALDLTLGMLA